MRFLKAGFAALAVTALGVAGCSQPAPGKDVEALITKLTTESFKGTATAATNVEALKAALPADLSITWGNLSFDQASGATLLTNFKVTPKAYTEIGIEVAELRLWDFDAEFAAARIKGQRLDESKLLAKRVDAKGVKMFGLAAFVNSMMDGYLHTVEPMVREIEPGAPAVVPATPAAPTPAAPTPAAPSADQPAPAPAPQVPGAMPDLAQLTPRYEKLDFSIDHVVFDNVNLRPYLVGAPAAPGDEFAEFMGMIQPFASAYHAIAVDGVAALNMKFDMTMSQAGAPSSVKGAFGKLGYKGLKGGDLDGAYIADVAYNLSQAANPTLGTPAMDMAFTEAFIALDGVKMDKLYGYLAKGALPPRTETNLMSFGKWTSGKQTASMAGKEFYSLGETTLDAQGFHWLIPTDIKATARDFSLNIGALVDIGASMVGQTDASAASEIAAARAALKKYDLEKLTGNFDFGWTWNAATGDAKLDVKAASAQLMDVAMKYEGGFPSFDAVSALIPDDLSKTNEAGLEQLFAGKTSLKLVDLNVVDHGGLTKLFAIAADQAKAQGGAASGMPAGMDTPEGMRSMASAAVQMGAAMLPDLGPVITPVGEFIQSGGRLHVMMQPATPMLFTELAALGAGPPTAETIKKLGLKAEHTK